MAVVRRLFSAFSGRSSVILTAAYCCRRNYTINGMLTKGLSCFSTNVLHTCWQCLHPGPRERVLCQRCGVVQEIDPNINYFKIFGIEQNFNIDLTSLTKAFRLLQAQIHPDKFARKSAVRIMLLLVLFLFGKGLGPLKLFFLFLEGATAVVRLFNFS